MIKYNTKKIIKYIVVSKCNKQFMVWYLTKGCDNLGDGEFIVILRAINYMFVNLY
jgi:hypothetical protein